MLSIPNGPILLRRVSAFTLETRTQNDCKLLRSVRKSRRANPDDYSTLPSHKGDRIISRQERATRFVQKGNFAAAEKDYIEPSLRWNKAFVEWALIRTLPFALRCKIGTTWLLFMPKGLRWQGGSVNPQGSVHPVRYISGQDKKLPGCQRGLSRSSQDGSRWWRNQNVPDPYIQRKNSNSRGGSCHRMIKQSSEALKAAIRKREKYTSMPTADVGSTTTVVLDSTI